MSADGVIPPHAPEPDRAELLAMARVSEILSTLTDPEIQRVLSWACARFGVRP